MDTKSKAEDYYDMPAELLPTANFAGRPTSDISMLDGLWTMIISSSSSSSSDGDDENDLLPPTSVIKSSREAQRQPHNPGVPEIAITEFHSDDRKPRIGSLGNHVKIMERPRMRKKANTTPSGAILQSSFAEPMPRRAISTILGHSSTVKGKEVQPAPSRSGTPVLFMELEYARTGPQKSLPEVPKQGALSSLAESKASPRFSSSFSQKSRVSETLEDRSVGSLKIDIVDRKIRTGPNSANSMLSTPREFYAIPKKFSSQDAVQGLHLTGRRSSESISPGTYSPSVRPVAESHVPQDTTNSAVRLTGLSRPQRIYLPGAISLEEHPAIPRRDSVATLDPFDQAGRKANRFSDMVMQESIIMYFDGLGVVAEVTEMTLDRYWLKGSEHTNKRATRRRSSSILSVKETLPMSPQGVRSPRGSKFSFSSASSTASSPGAQKRPRTRLGRMLSPGLPGSTFLKTPVLWGQQTKKS